MADCLQRLMIETLLDTSIKEKVSLLHFFIILVLHLDTIRIGTIPYEIQTHEFSYMLQVSTIFARYCSSPTNNEIAQYLTLTYRRIWYTHKQTNSILRIKNNHQQQSYRRISKIFSKVPRIFDNNYHFLHRTQVTTHCKGTVKYLSWTN